MTSARVHTTKQRLMLDTIERLLRRRAEQSLRKMINKVHAADLASLFPKLRPSERRRLFHILVDMGLAGDVLSELEPAVWGEVLSPLPSKQISRLVGTMASDDAAELLSQLPDGQRHDILDLMAEKEALELEKLLHYEEETAGRIMIREFFALPESYEVREAIAELQQADTAEMVFYVYVVDDEGHLIGVLSLRQLLLNPPDTLLRDICMTEVIRVQTDMDQEEVARLVARYDLLAIPVEDENRKLVGIITVDDIIDVIKEEASEDLLKLVGTGEEELLESSWLRSVRLRLPWLLASFVGGLGAVTVGRYFELVLSQVVALAFFIPVITGMGGNVGTQSSTIVVRGIATGHIDPKQLLTVIWREARVGVSLGLAYGLLLGGVAWGFFAGPTLLGVVVGVSIFTSMTLAATMGTIIPLVFHRVGVDPAVATGPFITTGVDVLTVSAYFGLATYFLV